MIRPPFKTHNGKIHIASWIIQYFPPNYAELGYIEPYVRAGGVFLNKTKSISPLGEAINDPNEGIVQIYRALRDEPGMFIGRIKRTKYCNQTFAKALIRQSFPDYMDNAVNEFILRRMSRNGTKECFAAEEEAAWNSIIEELPKIAIRMDGIYIFNKFPLDALMAYNDKDVLTFVDPPPLAESIEVATYEMSTDNHIKLWEVLNQFRGKAIISGTPSVLYKRLYSTENGWKCIRKKTNLKSTKIDCLWVNF
jgi:site-specific DNA-adenine methylase